MGKRKFMVGMDGENGERLLEFADSFEMVKRNTFLGEVMKN